MGLRYRTGLSARMRPQMELRNLAIQDPTYLTDAERRWIAENDPACEAAVRAWYPLDLEPDPRLLATGRPEDRREYSAQLGRLSRYLREHGIGDNETEGDA